jgi:uncharacterized membrane protein YcfT
MEETSQVTPRYDWVDYSKGICIIAVVCLYSTKFAHGISLDAGWMQYWADFARPFRMPDFFLLSGLFLHKVIDRSWSGYIDKKIVHYAYFFCLWTLISFAMLLILGEKQGTFLQIISDFWSMLSSWPYKMLWFIQMLPAYFLFTRLVRRAPKWIVLGVAIGLQSYPIFHTGRIMIDEFWTRYVYFYIGYAFAPLFFLLAEQAQKHLALAAGAVFIWVLLNAVFVFNGWSEKPVISILLGIAGATAIITVGAILSRLKTASWISYLGKHSIVVYLVFYWPMRYCAWLLVPYIGSIDSGLYVMVITIAGIVGAIFFYWFVKKTELLVWLFERPKAMVFGRY